MAQRWLGQTRKIRSLGMALALSITVVMLLLATLDPVWLQALEDTFLNFQFKVRGARPSSGEIVIVAVDEASLKEIGRWPWSRDVQAELVRAIAAGRPRVIGLDVIYTEPETPEALQALQTLKRLAATRGSASPAIRSVILESLEAADVDRHFEASLRAAGRVVLAVPFLVPEQEASGGSATSSTRPLPAALARTQFMVLRQTGGGEALAPLRAVTASPPLAPFAEAALSLGHVYTLPDRDGVTRHEYLALGYGDEDTYYPAFALEIARLALETPREHMALVLGEGIQLGDRFIPTDQKSRLLINYLGPHRTFPFVSAADVVRGRVPAAFFDRKVVLVGTAAIGAYDQKVTPLSANFPGVEKNATVVDNVLRQTFIRKSLWFEIVDYGLILVFGLTLGWALPRLRALSGALLALSLTAVVTVAVHLAFVTAGIWVDFVGPLLTILGVFIAVTVLRFMTEEKQAKEIHRMFSHYVSPRIVEELIKDPAKARLGGQRKELSMLFCDVAKFTSFSERRSAEDVVAQLNEYLTAMTEVIFRWNGTLDKFVGDAIVVFWGAPLDQPNHVELSIKCALHMRQRLGELQEKWRAEGREPFDNGIGINTGEVLVGNIGAEGKKMDYTMIGDQVNLAARVEGLTRKFPYPIILTEYTARSLKALMAEADRPGNEDRLGHVALHRLGTIRVVGKEAPVVAYGLEALGRDQASRVIEEAPTEVLELTEK